MLVATSVRAAPAVVRVFEAAVRRDPSPNSPVVHVFSEESALFVSEEVTDGWRRVRLPDGGTGYIRDADIRLVTWPAAPAAPPPEPAGSDEEAEPPARAAAPVEPLPRAAPAPPRRPARQRTTIYVKDLDHLAELVEPDNVIHPKAESLAFRQKAGWGVILGGGLVGSVVMVGSATFLATESCGVGNYADLCVKKANFTAAIVGSIIVGVAGLAGLFMLPTRSDLLDVINEWNERHPDEPFTIDRGPHISAD